LDITIQLDVLAIGAHPDDVELSVGGTMLKLAAMGYRTGIVDMSRGELGTRGTADIRAQEATEAARKLRLAVRENLGLPDGRIMNDPSSRLAVVRAIRKYQPKIIFTHYWEDPHPDHAHTSRIVGEAAHLAGLVKLDAEAGLGRHRPNGVAYFLFPHKVAPSFVVDISEFAAEKLEVIKSYRSQLFDPTSTAPETMLSAEGFIGRIEARQRYYGAIIDVEHGEAFHVRQALNVDDPVRLLTRTMSVYS
jgi:bacillithiol biosynthesis deacetylase BshB1